MIGWLRIGGQLRRIEYDPPCRNRLIYKLHAILAGKQ